MKLTLNKKRKKRSGKEILHCVSKYWISEKDEWLKFASLLWIETSVFFKKSIVKTEEKFILRWAYSCISNERMKIHYFFNVFSFFESRHNYLKAKYFLFMQYWKIFTERHSFPVLEQCCSIFVNYILNSSVVLHITI